MLSQVAPVLIVVVFWAVLFCLALYFSGRASRAPIEGEHEDAAVPDAEHTPAAGTADADHSVASGTGRP